MAEISGNMYESLIQQVQGFNPTIESVEVGFVQEVGDGIARVTGLNNIRFSELVRFANGVAGIAFNLERARRLPQTTMLPRQLDGLFDMLAGILVVASVVLGSVAEHLLHTSKLPLLVIP